VRKLLSEDDHTTDVVVLELCANRFADLRRAQQKEKSDQQQNGRPIQNFLRMVKRTTQQRGWATGMAAAVLGGASGLQTALSGFEAGSEFTTALDIASRRGCDILLADRSVDETLRRVGELPQVSLSMLQSQSFENESRALRTAIFGDPQLSSSQQISMPRVVTINDAVRGDMFRLMLPPLILAQLMVTVGQGILNLLDVGMDSETFSLLSFMSVSFDFVNLSTVDILAFSRDVMLDVSTSALVLFLGYKALALPAARVILCERDDPLADGIRTACEVAVARRSEQGGTSNARVVAVLGLLHVNGVAQRLLDTTKSGV
jgi:pheromone shutdown protein TraB